MPMKKLRPKSATTAGEKGATMNTSKTAKTRTEPHRPGIASKRGNSDSLQGTGESGDIRQWFGFDVRTLYILFGLSVIISILLYPNILTSPVNYSLGDVADRDIKASREFLVEDRALTEKNRQDTVKAVLSVYDFDRTSANVSSRINEAFAAGSAFTAGLDASARISKENLPDDQVPLDEQTTSLESFKNQFFDVLDIPPDNKVFDVFLKNGFPSEAKEASNRLISQVLSKGIVGNKMMLMSQSGKGIILHNMYTEMETRVTDLDQFYDLNEARAFLQGQRKVLSDSMQSPELATASLSLASALVKPNLTFNKRETELRKDIARKSVTPFYFKVKKGEMLVREGERVTSEQILKVTEQQKYLKENETIGTAPAMSVLIFFLLSVLYLVGFMDNPLSRTKIRDLLFGALTLLTVFLIVIAWNFLSYEIARGSHSFSPKALIFAMPVASGAMLVAIFHGIGVAVSFSLVACVLACWVVGGQVEFFVYFFIACLVAGHGVRDCRERGIFIRTGLKVGLCNVFLAVSILLLGGSFYPLEFLIAILSAFVGGIFVAVIATGLLPLAEMSFGYTTDIKLLELSNLDQPLLRELMVQAPGTYHHSVIVSNMVEAAAPAVNANPLLAKVAAYYHDIGKVRKPLYFIENQVNRENKHEKLAPSMSSLVLISHVKDGVDMAGKEKLGQEIIDIIRQHHGTSLISFFYEKAKEQEEKKGEKSHRVKEEDFRYPGPKPQTKEAGLVMLADVVEAASKTLVDPTVSRIQGMVQKIINKVFSDGQLDECELTLKDLNEIAKSFNKTLSGIFHHRIDYPEPVAKTSIHRKGENGDSDQRSAGDSRDKHKEDETKPDEALRRLGLS